MWLHHWRGQSLPIGSQISIIQIGASRHSGNAKSFAVATQLSLSRIHAVGIHGLRQDPCRNLIRGRCGLNRLVIFSRKHRKKSLAARWATIGGQVQQSPQKTQTPLPVLRGDALQFQAAALWAMRVAKEWDGDRPSVEAIFTIAASPGTHPRDSQKVVKHTSTPGATARLAEAAWTDHFWRPGANYSSANIGPARP